MKKILVNQQGKILITVETSDKTLVLDPQFITLDITDNPHALEIFSHPENYVVKVDSLEIVRKDL